MRTRILVVFAVVVASVVRPSVSRADGFGDQAESAAPAVPTRTPIVLTAGTFEAHEATRLEHRYLRMRRAGAVILGLSFTTLLVGGGAWAAAAKSSDGTVFDGPGFRIAAMAFYTAPGILIGGIVAGVGGGRLQRHRARFTIGVGSREGPVAGVLTLTLR